MSQHQAYLPEGVCLECQGQCCSRSPGPYHPSDFTEKVTVKYLLELLEGKVIVIDWHQSNGRATYFLRPPCDGDNSHFINQYYCRGECTFLNHKGCSLPFEKRPLGCRNLKPNKDMLCKATYGQYEAFRSWARHRKILEEVKAIIERRSKGDFSN